MSSQLSINDSTSLLMPPSRGRFNHLAMHSIETTFSDVESMDLDEVAYDDEEEVIEEVEEPVKKTTAAKKTTTAAKKKAE